MLKKPVTILAAIILIALVVVFFLNFRVIGLANVRLQLRKFAPNDSGQSTEQTSKKVLPPGVRSTNAPGNTLVQGKRTIRIATFNLDSLNETKMGKPHVLDIFVRIIREFDVVAFQEIQTDTDDVVPRLTDMANRFGGNYDHVVGPRLGPAGMTEQYAFVFDKSVVEVDRGELYTVDDRDDLMIREPLVAWFRVVGLPEKDAFTFSLVNVHIDPRRAKLELDILDDVMFEVRKDGRQEDDVILLGDFGATYREMGALSHIRDIGFGATNLTTRTSGSEGGDNLVFQKNPTVEFTGRCGVFDFLREYNLNMEQALEVSDHMPVWAEFSIFEGGEPGRVAMEGSATQTR